MTFRETTIAAVAIAALATPALAQTAEEMFEMKAAELSADASSIEAWAEEVAAIQDSPEIQVIPLSELGEQGQEFNTFLDSVELQFSEFWGKVAAQQEIASALKAEGYTAEDVVIFANSPTGSVAVYVDDLM